MLGSPARAGRRPSLSPRTRPAGLAALALLAGLVVGAPRGRAGDAPAAPTRLVIAGSVRALDPALVTGADDERLVLACFDGLTRLDEASGEVKPALAASWTTSPDGRTWTFKLRDQTWQKRFGEEFEEKGPVRAGDVVFAWSRLLDPALKSPHLHLLDALTGVRPLSTDKPRANGLDRVITDLIEAVGGEKTPKTLAGSDVETFLLDPDRNAKAWLGELEVPEAREFLTWSGSKPYPGPKARGLIGALRKAQAEALAAAGDAESHVGIDRGFYAPDDKTVVVETPGPSPWLPSLLARAPLVAVHRKTIERERDRAFAKRQYQVCNGRFVASFDFPATLVNNSGEATPFKVELYKNPKHPDAAKTGSDRVTVLVENGADEVLRQYGAKECHWIQTSALGLDLSKALRAAAAPGFAPDPKVPAQRWFAAAAPDVYDMVSGRVMVLRFRCAAPLDQKAARQALASLLSREALVKTAASVVPPAPTSRFVHPRTTGTVELPRKAVFDASKAKAMYGKRRFADGTWINIRCERADDALADAVGKAWKPVGDEVMTTVQDAADLRVNVDAGLWEALVEAWSAEFDDPLAYLAPFTTANPAGDCRWSSPLFDALVAGARDVVTFRAKPDAAAAALPSVKAALGGADAEALRRALLAEAEALLLEEAVVVPLWIPVDSGVVSKAVRQLATGNVEGRRPLLDVVPFTSARVEAAR